jgi:hypothetical protein
VLSARRSAGFDGGDLRGRQLPTWADDSAATWADAQRHHVGRFRPGHLIGVSEAIWRSSARPTSSVVSALIWSELTARRAAVLSGAQVGGFQRRDLRRAQRRTGLAVVRAANWAVPSAFRSSLLRFWIWAVVRLEPGPWSAWRTGRW